jgi:hypothetical protein
VVAGLLGGAAEVNLRRPVPLDLPLAVVRENAKSVKLLNGEVLLAEGRSVCEVAVEVPAPVTPGEARLAATRYRGPADGLFCRCFVCGRAREDAFAVFAGAVAGRELVASPWTPPAWTADASGQVRPEFVWAALDCPTYFASYTTGGLPVSLLARMAARIDAPVVAGEEHVVIAWPLETDGRKRHAGSAVLSADGRPLAVARALWIEPRQSLASSEATPPAAPCAGQGIAAASYRGTAERRPRDRELRWLTSRVGGYRGGVPTGSWPP